MAVDYSQALAAYQQLVPGADVSSQEGVDKFNAFWGGLDKLAPEVFSSAMQVLAKPDQRDAFMRDYGGNMDAWLGSVTNWWSANGHGVDAGSYPAEMQLID